VYEVMIVCVIMHNIIVEQERDEILHDKGWQSQDELVEPQIGVAAFEEFLHMHNEFCDIHISFVYKRMLLSINRH
jgi:hypothetical protein